MKPCSNPLCTNQVDDNDRFCGLCGTYVGPDITQVGRQCVNCGRTIQPGQNFCSNCGSFTTFFKPQPVADQIPYGGVDPSAATIPGTIAKYVNRGDLLLRLKRYEDALRMFDEVLRVNPDNVEALHGKLSALYVLKRYDDVIQLCENMLLDNWDDYAAHYWRGLSLSASERYYEASEAFGEAIRLSPDSPDSPYRAELHFERGFALLQFGIGEDALSAFDEALRLDPKNIVLHNYKARAFELLGDLHAMHVELEKGLSYFDTKEHWLRPKQR